MRILQVCPFSYDEVGGVSEHVRNISQRLARKHDVTVFATHAGTDFPRQTLKNGVIVENFRRYAPSDAYLFSLEMLLRITRVNFDIVHAHCYHAFPFHFSTLAKCKKLFLTTHFHGVGHSPFRNALIRVLKPFGERSLRKADRIVAVSEYEKRLLCEEFRFVEHKTATIPNGLDLKVFSGLRKGSKQSFRSILYVGYLFDYKGVHHLIEVLPKLKDDILLEIVGRGRLKSYLEKRAIELGVKDRVRFYDYLPRAQLLQKFADADVFILLSKYESYSIVVAEAIATGTPCIVANTSALKEWIDNQSVHGIDTPIDQDKLAKLVKRVLSRTNKREAMHNAKKWIGKKILDWDEVTRQLENLYLQ